MSAPAALPYGASLGQCTWSSRPQQRARHVEWEGRRTLWLRLSRSPSPRAVFHRPISSARSAPPDQLRAPPDQLLGLLLGLQDRGEPRPPPPVRSSWSRPPAPHAARGSSRHTLTHVHVAATREPLLALATEKQWRRGALPGARPFAASSPACRRRGVGRHRNGRFAAINVRVVPL